VLQLQSDRALAEQLSLPAKEGQPRERPPGACSLHNCDALVLFDSGASHSFVSSDFVSKHNLKAITLEKGSYCISVAGNDISTNQVVLGATLEIGDR